MPTKPENEFDIYEDILPENAVPLQGWKIVKYLDQRGTERYSYHCDGHPNVSDTVGMLGLVSFQVLHNSLESAEDYDEDD